MSELHFVFSWFCHFFCHSFVDEKVHRIKTYLPFCLLIYCTVSLRISSFPIFACMKVNKQRLLNKLRQTTLQRKRKEKEMKASVEQISNVQEQFCLREDKGAKPMNWVAIGDRAPLAASPLIFARIAKR